MLLTVLGKAGAINRYSKVPDTFFPATKRRLSNLELPRQLNLQRPDLCGCRALDKHSSINAGGRVTVVNIDILQRTLKIPNGFAGNMCPAKGQPF